MAAEKNKQFSIKFRPSLMEQVEKYIEVVNANKEPSEKKLNKASFFNNAIADYFEDKVITNDLIKLEKPFYFNWLELKEKGVVKASSEVPIHDLDLTFIVKAVPNNLDNWSNEEGTYFSGSSNIHKGLYIYYWFIHDSKNYFRITKIVEKNLLFKYDSSANTLEISLLNPNDLYLYVPADSDVLDKLAKEKEEFYKTIILDSDVININEWLNTLNVLRPYKVVKKISIYTSSDEFKEISERLDNAEKITYESEEGYFILNEDLKSMYNNIIKPSFNFNIESEKKEE